MKITEVKSFDLEIPYKVPFRPAHEPGRVRHSRAFTLVRIKTEDGLVGYAGGDGYYSAQIDRKVTPFLVGMDVFDTENHARVYRNGGGLGAWFLDMAVWDIIGKAANLPVYKLWGSAREKVLAYASAPSFLSHAEVADLCQRYYDEGFRAAKIRIHNETIAEDIAFVEAARKAVPDLIIMVDANQANFSPSPKAHPHWDYARALKTAKELERLGCYWLEEPFPYGRWDDYKRLTENTEIYITGGESLSSLYMFRDVIQQRVYDIVQPDPLYSEGISQMRKIAAMAEMFDIPCMPHMAYSGIGDSANLHLCCTIPGHLWYEFMYEPPSRTVEDYQQLGGLIQSKIWIDSEGYVTPSGEPGLGVVIDEDAIKHFAPR
jgi:D-galactarolactone cycloisomerase